MTKVLKLLRIFHATRTIYIPAFDDEFVISGQGTVGKEIFDELKIKSTMFWLQSVAAD